MAGSLTLQAGGLGVDSTSTLEIVNAGTAAAGTIVVDPGAVLSIGGDFAVAGDISIVSPILNNGNIVDIGGTTLGNVTNNGIILVNSGLLAGSPPPTLTAIGGAGEIIAGNAVLGARSWRNPGTDRRRDADLCVRCGRYIDTGNTPLIEGFATADVLVLQGVTADSAVYTASGGGLGTLTLSDGGLLVASLGVLGSYSSNEFTPVAGSGATTVTLKSTVFLPRHPHPDIARRGRGGGSACRR